MFQIFILNASRRLQADRFYTDDYRPEVYTEEGMQWVDDASLKSVILRHFPELAATGLGNVTQRLRAVGHRHLARSAPPPAPRLPARAQARPLARRRPPTPAVTGRRARAVANAYGAQGWMAIADLTVDELVITLEAHPLGDPL